MTSTLPNFPASNAVSAAPSCSQNAPAQAGLLPASVTAAGGASVEFAALLPAAPGAKLRLAPPVDGTGNPSTPAIIVPDIYLTPDSTPVGPSEISREELEQAAAFAMALLQSLSPAPSAPLLGLVDSSADSAAGCEAAPAMLSPTLELPGGARPGLRGHPAGSVWNGGQLFSPALPSQVATGLPGGRTEADASVAAQDPVVSGVAKAAFSQASALTGITVAADGALELRLEPSSRREFGAKPGAQTDNALEVCAELELPGQAVIRVEATVPAPVAVPYRSGATDHPVNFAGRSGAEKSAVKSSDGVLERKFVFTGDKQVSIESPDAGITVAKTDGTMSVVPTEENRSPRNPEAFSVLPVRADFQVAQSPAERITAAPTEAAGHNFAERAVATVTGLAEAQFSASMHKAGSVQLRLKFGGEDLNVRVELRDGVVHTDFRTDSPGLREALAKEWQAVAAAAPGHLQRFLDPVFSPASPSSATDQGAQHHSSQRQSPQQQAQDQSARPDAWQGQSLFSRRSALGESFVPEPAVPRVPVLLPTSLRLSVLA
jgi:hypothetical protein